METYATSVMLQGCMLVQGVILARLLGTEGRGDFAAIILWPNIIANIGLFGTNLAVTRAAASTDEDVGSVARAGVLLSIMLSAVTVAVGLLLLPYLIPKADSNILGLARMYMILFVPAYIISANLAGMDHGQGRFRRLNFFRLLQSPVYVLFLVVLIVLAKANLTYCLWAMLAAFWVTALGRFILLMREIPILGQIASLVRLLRYGIPYVASDIIVQLTYRGDRILLLWLLADRDLGLYVVAFSAAGILAKLPQSMGIVSLTIAAQQKPRQGFARIAQIFRGAVLISAAMGAALSAMVYILLPIVYGQNFEDARMTAIILAGGSILFGLMSLLNQSMKGQGKPMAGIIPKLAGLTAMAVLSIVLCPSLGANGVALGFVAAQAVSLCGLMFYTVRHYDSASLKDMIPTAKDVKLVTRRIREQTTAALKKVGIIRSPASFEIEEKN